MNTHSTPVKKSNFENSELKQRKQKAQKSERQNSKRMINKMISEDQEIEQALNMHNLEEEIFYWGIDWGLDSHFEQDYNS